MLNHYYAIILLISFYYSCSAHKKSTGKVNFEEKEIITTFYNLDSSNIKVSCFSELGLGFPVKNILFVNENVRSKYFMAALCLHQEVKQGNKEAAQFYWSVYDQIYYDWVVNKFPRREFVDSMATMKTKKSFEYLVKFLDVDTDYGGDDVLYAHDGEKIFKHLLEYLAPEGKIYYEEKYKSIYLDINFKLRDSKNSNSIRHMAFPIAHNKFAQLFKRDYQEGRIKFNDEIR